MHHLTHRRCAAASCEHYDMKDMKLFRFPRGSTTASRERYQQWADVAKNPRLDREKMTTGYLCARHFARNQFMDADCTMLMKKAVPTTEPISPDRNLSLIHTERHLSHPPCNEVVVPFQEANVSDEPISSPPPSKSRSFVLSFPSTSTPKSSCSVQLFPSLTSPMPSTSSECNETLVPLPDIFNDDTSTPKSKVKSKSLLSQLNCTRYSQLTPKKKFILGHAKKAQKALERLQKKYRKKTLDLQEISDLVSDPNYVVARLAKSMSLPCRTFLASQIRCSKREAKGRRWTQSEKLLALTLYKRSPKCYTLLRSIFTLPDRSTLISLLNQIPFHPGINTHIFDSLSKSFRMEDSDRICCLMFDEMSIRQHLQYDSKSDKILGFEDLGTLGRTDKVANHVLVFMARGLHRRKWKQPIAFYFTHGGMTSDIMQKVLQDVLTACKEAGLRVVSLVCDMGSNNVRTLKQLGVSKETPYFTFDGQEVVVLFDAPHLLKCTRNNLYKHDVLINVKVGENHVPLRAKWNHIRKVVAVDSVQSSFRLLHKVTPAHLDPVGPVAMRVMIAAQVLSHTVAGMIHICISNNSLETDALATAQYVQLANNTFDSVNGSSAEPQGLGGLKSQVMRGRENLHLQHWAKAAADIDDWQYIRVKKNGEEQVYRPPSQDGWLVTLRGLDRLWGHLKSCRFRSLEVRRLNQDCLEHLFGSIRAHCGSNCNPTVQQFVSALKTSIVNGLAFQGLTGANCENESDPGVLLNNLQGFLTTDSEKNSSSVQVRASSVNEETSVDHSDMYVDTMFSLPYVTGYICRRILTKDTCSKCRACLVSETNDDWFHVGMYFKEYSDTNRGLTYPTYEFVEAVGAGSTAIEKFLPTIAHHDGVKRRVAEHLLTKINFSWLEEGCSEHHLWTQNSIIKCICDLSFHWWCKKRNREFSSWKLKPWTRKMRIWKHE